MVEVAEVPTQTGGVAVIEATEGAWFPPGGGGLPGGLGGPLTEIAVPQTRPRSGICGLPVTASVSNTCALNSPAPP